MPTREEYEQQIREQLADMCKVTLCRGLDGLPSTKMQSTLISCLLEAAAKMMSRYPPETQKEAAGFFMTMMHDSSEAILILELADMLGVPPESIRWTKGDHNASN